MNHLLRWNNLRWPIRLPLKLAVLGVTVLAVCFPYPRALVRHIRHWRDPNALIEPDAEALAPLATQLKAGLPDDPAPDVVLKAVERLVYDTIKYDWDWNTWGMADYMPTVTEAIDMGREDCDGRAVVAASLLENIGIEASIVTDFAHVWVKTDEGETMTPTPGKRMAAVATDTGLELQTGALAELPRALAYGVAPFPLVRELIVLVVLWWLLLRTNGGAACALATLVLLLDGLLFLRVGGASYRHPTVWAQLVGAANLLGALLVQWVWAKRHASTAARSGPDPDP
ncbi:MAG: hypothetical protein ACE5E6_05640 [Phycisphaerae bacterium]